MILWSYDYDNNKLLLAWWIDATTNIECVIISSKVGGNKSITSALEHMSFLCALLIIGLLL
jgi:hypothetical protein